MITKEIDTVYVNVQEMYFGFNMLFTRIILA